MSSSRTPRTPRRVLAVALMACIAVGGAAHAQSNAAGSIFGTGEPGATVRVENLDTGLSREIQVGANGRYAASALPTGRYRVTLQRDGEVLAAREDVLVRLGAGSEVAFAPAGGATELDRVVVTGIATSMIDVSATDTRSVFTEEQLELLPVGHSITDVALLAPGVVQGDSRYGSNAASFGGSAASENAYYINGYAVTNPLTNIGSTTLPFAGISQMQAITGGYGAEFGRATGGVVNIVTKRGGNEWEFGGIVTWEPDALRSDEKNIYYPDNGTANDGLLYQKRDARRVSEMTAGLYAGGPIIRDRLFVYANAEISKDDIDGPYSRGSAGPSGYYRADQDIPRWMAKVDWNIAEDHLLELTAVSDVTKEDISYYDYSYTGDDAFQPGNIKNGGYYYEDGGELYIGKYTGYLTDNLTLTALYGEQELEHIALPYAYDPSVVYVSDNRNTANPVRHGLYAQLPFPDAYDKTDGGRVDLEWRLGDHALRLGYDRQDSESRQGQVVSGPGYRWIYDSVGAAAANDVIPGSGGARGPGGNGDYVRKYIYANGGTFSVEQEAWYLEDRWQVTDNWLLSLGVRNEGFKNFNADGVVYAQQDDQWAPRIGVSWDVRGDSTLKVFANAGRYHLAMPNNVALRGAAGSLYTNEYFSFTGIDPVTGEPLGLVALGDGPHSSNNEYGQAPDPRTVTAKDVESHYQDEFVLGFQMSLTPEYDFGARYVYRDLKSAIDDMCDFRPAYYWAIDQGLGEDMAAQLGNELANCRLFNPGEDNTFLLSDGAGGFVEVPLTAEQLGFPALKRTYQGIDLFLEHPFDGRWYGRVDYTWSRNYGNAEGQLKSDVGQGDVSQTMDWDHPELMENSSGYLPNHRKHYLKAFGYYQLNPQWLASASLTYRSGRPKNCFGIHVGGTDEFRESVEYGGPYYFYCNGQPSVRGSAGNLPSETLLNLGLMYQATDQIRLGVDVFNVFDRQVEQNVVEYGELGASGNPYHSTNRVISYGAPRSVRFTVRYDF